MSSLSRRLFSVGLLVAVPLWVEAQSHCANVWGDPTKHEVLVELAAKADLRYLEGSEPGYSRRKVEQVAEGKRTFVFTYLDPAGRAVSDPALIARFDALGLPPAYENVWISADSRTHLQATGVDAKGRRQYRYHDAWNEVRDTAKFDRLVRFGHLVEGLRAEAIREMGAPGAGKNKQIGVIVRLLEVAVIRIGNEGYAGVGLTTMKPEHVRIEGSQVFFDFVGKSHKRHDFSVNDPSVARALADIVALRAAGEPIFTVDSADVNGFIKERSRGPFSAKDFRTWVGTLTAARTLHELGAAKSGRQREEFESRAAAAASEKLHNTPAVARASYIHPLMFEAAADGRLEQAFGRGARPGRTLEESAVLRLLDGEP